VQNTWKKREEEKGEKEHQEFEKAQHKAVGGVKERKRKKGRKWFKKGPNGRKKKKRKLGEKRWIYSTKEEKWGKGMGASKLAKMMQPWPRPNCGKGKLMSLKSAGWRMKKKSQQE